MQRKAEWLCSSKDEELFEIFKDSWFVTSYRYLARKRRISDPRGSQAVRFHHEVMRRMGIEVGTYYVDHIDGNMVNNRRDNLRLATNSQNQANRGLSKTNTSGYKGVSFNKNEQLFKASIMVMKNPIHLGWFKTKEEAAIAYNTASRLYFPEFGYQNIII